MLRLFFTVLAAIVSTSVFADQRMETTGAFCHFVTPQGLRNGNDDNELFVSNCVSTIRQRVTGRGYGFVSFEVDYPRNRIRSVFTSVSDVYKYTGAETGINCVMVDSNDTTYVTGNWVSTYQIVKQTPDVDTVRYSLTCKNGAQQ